MRATRWLLAVLLSFALCSVAVAAKSDSETKVHITKTGKKWHAKGCQYLKKSDIIITLAEAKKRGLTACSKCDPPK